MVQIKGCATSAAPLISENKHQSHTRS